ncbi:SMC-Scp complex subunit ScpB [Falseniella ignava]|uniref:Segregation and condensation protein B n=1 Tax=Falseniella ignava TaxID=137730 RepID=A0A2I1JXY5_9LACT|nr:SMC-Scp complex subunit ScpB [Falseniella ignava]PKY88223.1 SMC-Scp complex subunit ScpB [Falseniella ignava]
MKLEKRILGIIFVAGDEGVTYQELAQTLAEDLNIIQDKVTLLMEWFDCNDYSPIKLTYYNQALRFVTKSELSEDVENFAKAPFNQALSKAAIETLAIIAYRQPVTRMTVDEIRGVNSSSLIQRLINRDLVQEVGRIEAPGRPVLYSVTDYFMDYFGLESLDDLPEIEPLALNAQLVSDELFELYPWQLNSEEIEEVEKFDEIEGNE